MWKQELIGQIVDAYITVSRCNKINMIKITLAIYMKMINNAIFFIRRGNDDIRAV